MEQTALCVNMLLLASGKSSVDKSLHWLSLTGQMLTSIGKLVISELYNKGRSPGEKRDSVGKIPKRRTLTPTPQFGNFQQKEITVL